MTTSSAFVRAVTEQIHLAERAMAVASAVGTRSGSPTPPAAWRTCARSPAATRPSRSARCCEPADRLSYA